MSGSLGRVGNTRGTFEFLADPWPSPRCLRVILHVTQVLSTSFSEEETHIYNLRRSCFAFILHPRFFNHRETPLLPIKDGIIVAGDQSFRWDIWWCLSSDCMTAKQTSYCAFMKRLIPLRAFLHIWAFPASLAVSASRPHKAWDAAPSHFPPTRPFMPSHVYA